jgi:hypothetical protein
MQSRAAENGCREQRSAHSCAELRGWCEIRSGTASTGDSQWFPNDVAESLALASHCRRPVPARYAPHHGTTAEVLSSQHSWIVIGERDGSCRRCGRELVWDKNVRAKGTIHSATAFGRISPRPVRSLRSGSHRAVGEARPPAAEIALPNRSPTLPFDDNEQDRPT